MTRPASIWLPCTGLHLTFPFIFISFLLICLSISLSLCMFLVSLFHYMYLALSLPVSDSVITSPPSYTLSFVYMQLYVEFITVLTLAGLASAGRIDGRYGERCKIVSALRVCTCVSKCMCVLTCACAWAWHVCVDHGGIPWAICTGPVHLRNCLWVWGCSQCSGPLAQISHSQNS